MMRRGRYKVRIGAFLLGISVLLAGCGRSDSNMSKSDEYTTSYEEAYDMAETKGMSEQESISENATADSTTTESETSSSVSVETNRKIIRRISMALETQEFDGLIESIEKQVAALGGYAESINMNDLLSNSNRYCSMVIRIPSAQLDTFVNGVSKEGNVVSKNMSTEDVTLNYVDTESHIKVLKVEQERLLALIEKADDLESIIVLENRLTEIRYQLESYESQLRSYDNLIEYSTVDISIEEVIHYTPTVDQKSVWSKMKTGLENTIQDIKDDVTAFVVWLVTNIPYVLIWGGILIVAAILIKKKIKNSKQNNNQYIQPNSNYVEPLNKDNEERNQ
ncbi:DUF4349 domain-containing protein [Anaerosporobacter faecicola]|uniref:DUF4349 domain-containing protein n=1 Tax=Anaerosporobacter faecicola TaxID=2718714 RepID=UPI001438BD20|nr:DUF4349 domain-containing protein [Anaerosporobacter faecicola]